MADQWMIPSLFWQCLDSNKLYSLTYIYTFKDKQDNAGIGSIRCKIIGITVFAPVLISGC